MRKKDRDEVRKIVREELRGEGSLIDHLDLRRPDGMWRGRPVSGYRLLEDQRYIEESTSAAGRHLLSCGWRLSRKDLRWRHDLIGGAFHTHTATRRQRLRELGLIREACGPVPEARYRPPTRTLHFRVFKRVLSHHTSLLEVRAVTRCVPEGADTAGLHRRALDSVLKGADSYGVLTADWGESLSVDGRWVVDGPALYSPDGRDRRALLEYEVNPYEVYCDGIGRVSKVVWVTEIGP